MTFVEACELLTEILVGKKTKKKVKRKPRKTSKKKSDTIYTRKKK